MAKKTKNMITCTLKCRIDDPDKDLAKRLHGLRIATYHAMNNCIVQLTLDEKMGTDVHPQTRAYQLVSESMEGSKIYANVRTPAANAAYKEWATHKKSQRKGECRSFPSFKKSGTIIVAPVRWELLESGDYFDIKIALSKDEPEYVLRARVKGARYTSEARSVANGAFKKGELRIMWSDKDREWSARVVYSKALPTAREGQGVLAVARGIDTFLYFAEPTGGCDVLFHGDDIVEFKKRLGFRKASLQRHMRAGELGDGAKGHGRARRYEALTKIGDAEARFVRTKCQQAAAAVVKKATEIDASTVLIEDYSTVDKHATYSWIVKRWPWYQLKQCIEWACLRAGIRTVEVDAIGLSRACPKCKGGGKGVVGKDGGIICLDCGFMWRSDAVSCWNMLKRSGYETGIDEAIKNHKSKVSKLKEKLCA